MMEKIERSKIERSKFAKFAALILACALLVGAMISVGISADSAPEITETASISSKNVEHRDYLHLAFKVEVESAPEDAVVGIMIWSAGAKSYTAANKIWESYEIKNDGAGSDYYASQPIVAKDIGTEYQIAVVAKTDEGITLLSEPISYSVEAWANEKLTNETDPARINLYKKVVAYGKAASTLLDK